MTPGETIKAALKRLKWSETRLANEAGIDRGAIHKIADDEMPLGRERAERIARALSEAGVEVSLRDLLPVRTTPREVARLKRLAQNLLAEVEAIERRVAGDR